MVEVLDGLVVLPEVAIGVAPADVGHGVIGGRANGLVVFSSGLLQTPPLLKLDASIVMVLGPAHAEEVENSR